MSNTAMWMIGSVLIAAGVIVGLWALGVPQIWIAVAALIVIGFGIHGAVRKTRRKEPPPEESRSQPERTA